MAHTKRYALSVAILIATTSLFVACGNFGSFTFTEESDVIVVEGQGNLLTNLFPTRIPMDIDLEQELEKQDASGAESVHLIDLYFEMEDDTDEEDFDFMDDITVDVSSESHPEKQLAWKDPIPTGTDRFELDVDDDLDLKPYAEEGLRLNTSVSGSSPDDDARFKVYAEFRVHVW